MNNVKFDVSKVMADLGISSMEEAKYVGVKADGSYAQESDAGTNGFWYDMDGFASGLVIMREFIPLMVAMSGWTMKLE